jgi:hypothetical protein
MRGWKWRLAAAVTWRTRLAAVVTWRLVSMRMPSLGPFRHSQGGQRGRQRRLGGGGMVVVGGIDVMGQLLIINILILIKMLIQL